MFDERYNTDRWGNPAGQRMGDLDQFGRPIFDRLGGRILQGPPSEEQANQLAAAITRMRVPETLLEPPVLPMQQGFMDADNDPRSLRFRDESQRVLDGLRTGNASVQQQTPQRTNQIAGREQQLRGGVQEFLAPLMNDVRGMQDNVGIIPGDIYRRIEEKKRQQQTTPVGQLEAGMRRFDSENPMPGTFDPYRPDLDRRVLAQREQWGQQRGSRENQLAQLLGIETNANAAMRPKPMDYLERAQAAQAQGISEAQVSQREGQYLRQQAGIEPPLTDRQDALQNLGAPTQASQGLPQGATSMFDEAFNKGLLEDDAGIQSAAERIGATHGRKGLDALKPGWMATGMSSPMNPFGAVRSLFQTDQSRLKEKLRRAVIEAYGRKYGAPSNAVR